MTASIFWVLAIVSVMASLSMIMAKNPVRSALGLVVTFLCMAVFYVTLSAHFLAAVQVIVYAGAIMVLFLFVIMLLNLGAPQGLEEKKSLQPPVAYALGACFLIALATSRSLFTINVSPAFSGAYDQLGTVRAIGLNLYDPAQPWLFPFEITSILLLTGVVGAIVMAKRRI